MGFRPSVQLPTHLKVVHSVAREMGFFSTTERSDDGMRQSHRVVVFNMLDYEARRAACAVCASEHM